MNLYKQVIAAIASMFSLALMVALQLACEHGLDFNPFGLMMLFVVPVGAFGMGALSALGYFLGCRALHLRPGRVSAAFTAVLALAAQLTIYFGRYWFEQFDGQQVRELIGFVDYTHLYLGTQTFALAPHGRAIGDGVELGWMGYVLALVQFVGLCVGASSAYFMLSSKPWCAVCDRFMKEVHTEKSLVSLRELTMIQADVMPNVPLLETDEAQNIELVTTVSGCSQCPRGAVQQVPSEIRGKERSAMHAHYRMTYVESARAAQQHLSRS